MEIEFFEVPDDLSQIDRDFNHTIKRLSRKASDGRTRSILNFIYSYGVKVIQDNKREEFLKTAIEKSRNCDMKAKRENIFAIIIEVYVRPNIKESPDYKLGSGQRSLYSRSLAYAAEHKISPNYLHGFLKMAGGYEKAAKKYLLKRREPWVADSLTFD